MRLTLQNTWLLLLGLILAMSATAYFFKSNPYFWQLIWGLSAFKFALVGFRFMELYKAHSFWKYLLVGYYVLFAVLLIMLK